MRGAMAAVHPSSLTGASLIGAQAYSTQLRQQYSQAEAGRIAAAKASLAQAAAREQAPAAGKTAAPLTSPAGQREAVNPNARFRITPPGSYLNIVI